MEKPVLIDSHTDARELMEAVDSGEMDAIPPIMTSVVGKAAMWEQMAEECTELAQACLKKARLIRGENKPRKTPEEVDKNVREEWTDVAICMNELCESGYLDLFIYDEEVAIYKLNRFMRNARKDGLIS